jgi:L-ribulose-5-phosphate 3-epimerase
VPKTIHRWGIYEKALPRTFTWEQRLAAATAAGYDFMEISIDEGDHRLSRLEWPRAARRELHDALAGAEASIDTMCLSAGRKYALGSADPALRARAREVLRRAIDFAVEFGIRIVQVAGYDAHYEPRTAQTEARFFEGIVQAGEWARQSCVMLAVETVECPLVDSVEKAMRLVVTADTPWFQVYPDIGNLTAMQKDVSRELELGGRHMVGLHLKDATVGVFRNIPFGQGIVDFDAAFSTLRRIGFTGPFMVEMWNEDSADAEAQAAAARQWLGRKVEAAFTPR